MKNTPPFYIHCISSFEKICKIHTLDFLYLDVLLAFTSSVDNNFHNFLELKKRIPSRIFLF